MKKNIFFLILILLSNSLSAQIPIGSFRAHLPCYGFNSVAVAPDVIYASNESGVMYYDKTDGSKGFWTKVEGLSETHLSCIFYEKNSHLLVIGYQSGNLDFINDDGEIHNLPDIKNKPMTGSKKILNTYYYNGVLYITCPFGIVLIDPETLLIRDTWYTRNGDSQYYVNDLKIFNNQFYIATSAGLFHTPANNAAIADFSTWQSVNELGDNDFRHLCPFGNKLYTSYNIAYDHDSLFVCENGSWHTSSIPMTAVRAMASDDNGLYVADWINIAIYDSLENRKDLYYIWDFSLYPSIQDIALDGQNIWVADAGNGLILKEQGKWSEEHFSLGGAYSSSVYDLDYVDNVVAYVPGGVTATWWHQYTEPNFCYYTDNQWNTILQHDNPQLSGGYDLTAVAINPRNTGEFFAGSFEMGLIKYNGTGVATVYNKANSPLRSRDTLEACIGGLAFDANNNLWISNCYSDRPLVVLKNDGTWQVFPLSSYVSGNSTAMGQILIDSRGYKWIVQPRNNTIIVLNDNGTISTPSDDQVTNVNMNAAANIETSSVNCIAEDKDGQIWIGCNLGIKVIFNPAGIFNGGVYPQNILIEQINYVQNLFEFEEVTAIAVDDGNRKWVGTANSGVYLISADGSEQLLHFTADDSPLLGNRISDITINRKNGEVFFATSNGLISYRGSATAGSENYRHVSVFPNPVRENYRGTIAVSGLMDHSFCKIADAAGNLVWQGYANGGEFTWDGTDFYGNRPATGVYFVFASDESGKEKNVAKILFIH